MIICVKGVIHLIDHTLIVPHRTVRAGGYQQQHYLQLMHQEIDKSLIASHGSDGSNWSYFSSLHLLASVAAK